MKRKVRITLLRNRVWFVTYIERRKYQHHAAAQFAADTHDLAFVQTWVRNQPNLELVN